MGNSYPKDYVLVQHIQLATALYMQALKHTYTMGAHIVICLYDMYIYIYTLAYIYIYILNI